MTAISKELQQLIDNEAEVYAEDLRRNQYKIANESFKKGANSYAPYKERWEQAKKALEEIVKIHDQYYKLNIEHPSANHLRNIAFEALASWKGEEKEGGV